MTVTIQMKRGAEHPVFGYYVGGCPINDNYQLSRPNPFKYTSQLQNVKQLLNNETKLINNHSSTSPMKFDGNLELTELSPLTEINKDQFFEAVSDTFNLFGLHTFFYLPFEGDGFN